MAVEVQEAHLLLHQKQSINSAKITNIYHQCQVADHLLHLCLIKKVHLASKTAIQTMTSNQLTRTKYLISSG